MTFYIYQRELLFMIMLEDVGLLVVIDCKLCVLKTTHDIPELFYGGACTLQQHVDVVVCWEGMYDPDCIGSGFAC